MKKILCSRRKGETQIFILENGTAQNYFIERDNEPPRLLGSIFKARVEKILPNMKAAFADIGRDKNIFLQFQKNLRAGDSVLIQIEKDAEHYKAARATLEISLPAQKIILLPTSNKIHVSRKISDAEKLRLKSIAKEILPPNCGVIIRTAAENAAAEELRAEIAERWKFWQELLKVAANKKKPSLIYCEDLLGKILRENISEIQVFVTDNLKIFRRVENLIPPENLLHYEGEDLFKMFGVDADIKSLTQKELPLPSGGFIVIEKTEALTVIDVNTGGADDICQTNIEAAELAMKQIRLRNIGGIIIIDFVNMKDDTNKKNLLEYLQTLTQIDGGKTFIVDMTPLGLVEITRQAF